MAHGPSQSPRHTGSKGQPGPARFSEASWRGAGLEEEVHRSPERLEVGWHSGQQGPGWEHQDFYPLGPDTPPWKKSAAFLLPWDCVPRKHVATRKFHPKNQAPEPAWLSSFDPILPGLLRSRGQGQEAMGELYATQGGLSLEAQQSLVQGKGSRPGSRSTLIPPTHSPPQPGRRPSPAPPAVPGHPFEPAYLALYLSEPTLDPLMDSSSPEQPLPFF